SESILFPGVFVGPGARLHRCVIDKNVEIPAGRVIGHDAEADRCDFAVSDRGVVVVEKDRRLS
ncbi:MAG TPA: glucose-1-phosphate adenylyltransferase, partial [Ilumatobacteraceae bacterium]|nr:glucose-1-phosphate adenylyltransferase [Ilumatobacteraceae bacterium]